MLSEDLQDLERNWPLSRVIPLDQELIKNIVVIGAYKGRLMEWLAIKYQQAGIFGFEPQKWSYEEAIERLRPYGSRINIANIGLLAQRSDLSKSERLYAFGTDSCSLYDLGSIQSKELGTGTFVDAIEAFRFIPTSDLTIINIEGFEIELVPYMLLNNIRSERLAIQFHRSYFSAADYGSLLYSLDKIYAESFNYFLPSWGYWEESRYETYTTNKR